MNRIQLPSWKQGSLGQDQTKTANSTTDPATAAVGRTASDFALVPLVDQTSLAREPAAPESPYSLFGPLHYEPNYAYPLLIWLHGSRDDERQVQQIMPLISLRNYVAVGPRGTCRSHDDLPAFHWGASLPAIVNAEQAVFDCLSVASQRFHVNPAKVFVAGYGSGGTMALRVALRNPELFAGAASLGGRFPRGNMPLVAWSRLPGLKLLVGYGRDSQAYSVDQLCEDLHLFHAARLAVAVRQYPQGDELRSNMLEDLNRWMMEIVTGQVAEAAATDALPEVEAN